MPCNKCYDRGYRLNESKEFIGFCDCIIGIKHANAFKERSLNSAGIYKEYWHKTMADFYRQESPTQQMLIDRTAQAIGMIDVLRNTNFLWIIWGASGTGKTLSGSLILMAAIQKGYPSKYVIWSDILHKRIDEGEQSMDQLKNVDFLVIDKVGVDVMKDSKYPAETLDLILNYRHSNNKPTIVILDNDFESVRRRLPILGQLSNAGNVLEVQGKNYRTQALR